MLASEEKLKSLDLRALAEDYAVKVSGKQTLNRVFFLK